MATTRVPDVLDFLVTLFTNDVTLGTAPAPNTVAVYDGPTLQQTPTLRNLYVGLTDPDADEPVSANSVATWAGQGRQSINEDISIQCCAEAWSGDTDPRTQRQAAYAIFGAVQNLIRGEVQLSGGVLWWEPVGPEHELRQDQTDQGARAKVLFRIEAHARI